MDIKTSEIMAARAARELRDGDVVFVGIGLPNLACNLARATHAPHLFMIYESGAVGTVPERLPISIGDPALVTDSLSVVPQVDIFQNYLQRGFIEVGFLGGAQIDRYGNINTTVIGDYHNPKVRLPGSGGACEIAYHSKRLLIVMRMSPKTFVEKCDFVTSPGHRYSSRFASPEEGRERKELGLPGGGPTTVITDHGVFGFEDGQMQLQELYPTSSIEAAREACGWQFPVSSELKEGTLPDEKTVRLMREKLDPQGLFLK